MKRKKFLALALAGVMTAVTLTACAPLDAAELVYDWLFGGGSSNASRGNGTGLVESETLEKSIIQWFGLSSATRKKDEAEPVLQEVVKSFDPGSWYKDNGELNDTAKAALDRIVKDKLTTNGSTKYTFVDVWEVVQPSQMDSAPSPDRYLYEDAYYSTGGGSNSDEPTHSSTMYSYGVEKRWMESYIPSINTVDVYASVFQKNGKTYAAMVIIW